MKTYIDVISDRVKQFTFSLPVWILSVLDRLRTVIVTSLFRMVWEYESGMVLTSEAIVLRTNIPFNQDAYNGESFERWERAYPDYVDSLSDFSDSRG